MIGRLCRQLWVNDVAPVALALCGEQLDANGIAFTPLPGPLESVDMPPVDLVVGCFIVYNRPTRDAVSTLLASTDIPVLLVNEELEAFRSLLAATARTIEPVGDLESPTIVLLNADQSV